jgi:ATP-dependent Lon protease
VLPIGGLKEKVLAAGRAGITTVIIPRHNEKDLDDVPLELRKGMTFVPVDTIDDVLPVALRDGVALPAGTPEAPAEPAATAQS